MKFLERNDSKEILLNTIIASIIVNHENPQQYLQDTPELKDFIPNNSEICFSRCHGDQLEYFNNLHEIKYLIINDENMG